MFNTYKCKILDDGANEVEFLMDWENDEGTTLKTRIKTLETSTPKGLLFLFFMVYIQISVMCKDKKLFHNIDNCMTILG